MIFWSLSIGLLFSIALSTKSAPIWSIVLVGFLWVAFLFWKFPNTKKVLLGVSILVFSGASFFGWIQGMSFLERFQEPSFYFLYGQEVEIIGVVNRESDERFTNVKVTLSPHSVCSDEACFYDTQNIIMTLPLGSQISYGDDVWFSGRLDKPENFTGESGREFDYVGYLAKDNIRGTMYYPEFEIIETAGGNPVKRSLYNVKNSLVTALGEVMPAPAAWLGAGIVYGEKQALAGDLQNVFRRVGLMHLVVLSGYNVTIIADGLRRMTLRFGVRVSAFFGIVGIILFALLVGGGSTILRASIMATLVIVAKVLGRPAAVTRLLVIAGLSMLIINPLTLWFDISFQLSFLATLGLIYISPSIEKRLRWLPEKFQLRQHAAATLSAQIAVLPILATAMGELSLIAPVVNLFVLPVMPVAMAGVALTSVLGIIWMPMAQVAMLPTAGVLTYVITIAEWFSTLPFSVVSF
jgi:competence protein ComEC